MIPFQPNILTYFKNSCKNPHKFYFKQRGYYDTYHNNNLFASRGIGKCQYISWKWLTVQRNELKVGTGSGNQNAYVININQLINIHMTLVVGA